MCLTEAALVLGTGPDELLVLAAGRESRVTNLLVPDASVGDRVLIGLGMVLARAPATDPQPATAPHDGRRHHLSQGGP
jgi:hypothetical protein